jgi:hypothetical protein
LCCRFDPGGLPFVHRVSAKAGAASRRQVLDFGFCNMHWKVINPLSKSILVINPFLPNFAQCAVTIWNAEDWLAVPTLLAIVPPLSSPMTLSPVCPSKLPPELAQPATKGSATRTGITKTIRDMAYNSNLHLNRTKRLPGGPRKRRFYTAAVNGTHQCSKLTAKYSSRNAAEW